MRTIHVCVGHDDDPAVTQLGNIESAFVLAIAVFLRFADACANGGDHRLNLVVLEKLVLARFLDVDQLAADRQNRLITPVAPLFGGAASRITFYDIKFGQFRIAFGTIRQFPRQSATGESAFTNRFPRFSSRLSRARSSEYFVEDTPRDGWILVEIRH